MRKAFFIIFLFPLILCSCINQTEAIELKKKESKKELTLLIYMAADNDLEPYALQNLKQLEWGIGKDLNVLVLLDRADGYDETEGNWTDTRLFEVVHDKRNTSALKSRQLDCPPLGLSVSQTTELDMANPAVLRSFIEFGKEHYEAEKYALVIWGHGNGWRAVTIDERSSSYMSLHDLALAVRGQGLCVIGFDTCFGGVIENVYELKDCAEYTIASPGVTPSGGWNYKNLLQVLETKEIKVTDLIQKMAENANTQTSIFINAQLYNLMDRFEHFSMLLAQSICDSTSQASVFQNLLECKSYSYNQYPCDLYLDINSIAECYLQKGDTELSGEAEKLKKALHACILSSDGQSDSAGIGIHFTEKPSAGTVVGLISSDYKKDPAKDNQNLFIKESNWWVPTINGNSGSLLDKLFYTTFD